MLICNCSDIVKLNEIELHYLNKNLKLKKITILFHTFKSTIILAFVNKYQIKKENTSQSFFQYKLSLIRIKVSFS